MIKPIHGLKYPRCPLTLRPLISKNYLFVPAHKHIKKSGVTEKEEKKARKLQHRKIK